MQMQDATHEKAIIQQCDAHTKQRQQKEEEDTEELLQQLESLKSYEITLDSQRISGQNTIQNEQRKNENNEISTNVKELIKIFKKKQISNAIEITKDKINERVSKPLCIHEKTENKQNDKNNSPSNPNKQIKRDIDKINPIVSQDNKNDEIKNNKLDTTGDNFRDSIADKFGLHLGDTYESKKIGKELEKELFNEYSCGDTKNTIYRGKIRVLMSNLRDIKNKHIREYLLNGIWKPKQLALMSENDMASDEIRQQRQRDEEYARELRKTDRGMGTKGTDLFTCSRCKKSNCTFYQKQTRSADEPMTIFITCLECQHKWRQ